MDEHIKKAEKEVIGCEHAFSEEKIKEAKAKIKEAKEKIIEGKRVRNSLASISIRIPTKILGYIFVLTIPRLQDHSVYCVYHSFNGLEQRSHSFLLVCHHWFMVASQTPELVWSFWGNTLHDWDKWCHHTRTAPLDLVLDGYKRGPELGGRKWLPVVDRFHDSGIPSELSNHAKKDLIRQIHLKDNNSNLLNSILSYVTPEEGVQQKQIESLVFGGWAELGGLLDFFARLHLPSLQCLGINATIKSPLWDHIAPLTNHLTTLSLNLHQKSHPPSTSQLFSILNANPKLQNLSLHGVLPDELEDLEIQVPCLRHLRVISVSGRFRAVFQLLERLELPAKLDYMDFSVEVSMDDIHPTVGPWMQGFLQCNVMFKGPLTLSIRSSHIDIKVPCLSHIGVEEPVAKLSMRTSKFYPSGLTQLAIDLMRYIPREQVECLEMDHHMEAPELYIAMPKLKHLQLYDVVVSGGFLWANIDWWPAGQKVLPLLQSLDLVDVFMKDDNWQPLVTYLQHQCSNGPTLLLKMIGRFVMSQEVKRQIKPLVKKLKLHRGCDCCSWHSEGSSDGSGLDSDGSGLDSDGSGLDSDWFGLDSDSFLFYSDASCFDSDTVE